MSEAKQTLLFPGELGLSAHRVCHAIEILPMHCKLLPYTTDGRWSCAHSICCIRAHALLADYNRRQMELTTTQKVQVMHASLPPGSAAVLAKLKETSYPESLDLDRIS